MPGAMLKPYRCNISRNDMIQVFGCHARTRSLRVAWALEEIGVDYGVYRCGFAHLVPPGVAFIQSESRWQGAVLVDVIWF